MFLKNVLLFIALLAFAAVRASDDDELYESADGICNKCNCTRENGTLEDGDSGTLFTLDCSMKPFERLFAKWPEEMGDNHTGMELHYISSLSSIEVLRQLPTTDAKVFFTCRHCRINEIVPHAFIDAANIALLDLAYNDLESIDMAPEIFRGPESDEKYAPIKLRALVLQHNKISFVDKLFFEHAPDLRLLDLSHNPIHTFDEGTKAALASLHKLEILDLSYTGIMELPGIILEHMEMLHELFLNGNNFLAAPESLFSVGETLQYLHLSDNPIEMMDRESFVGLSKLKQLNISALPNLAMIEKDSLKYLTSLEVLHCRGNSKLKSFDMENLRELKHLKELDITNNMLTSLDFGDVVTSEEVENLNSDQEINKKFEDQEINKKFEDQFKRLRILKLAGNPWNCDCPLLTALLLFDHNATYFRKSEKDDDARCKTPSHLASKFIYQIPSDHACVTLGRQKIPLYDAPQFLRPKSIMLTVFSVIGVIVLGIFIGFAIVCIKRKLKSDDPGYSSSPIRYTNVPTIRDSTISNIVNTPYAP